MVGWGWGGEREREREHDPRVLSVPQVRNLCIIYLVCAILAMVIISVLLDPIKLDKESSVEDRRLSPKLLIATGKHLISSRAQMLLIPLTVYSGVEQAFVGGDYTQVICSCRSALLFRCYNNNNVVFYALLLHIGAHGPLQSKEQNTVKTNFCEHAHTPPPPPHTHTESIG